MNTATKKESNIVPLKMFRTNTEKYITGVAKGDTFVIMRRSRPVFRLVPVEEKWETAIDFSQFDKKGVSVDVLLKHLKDGR